MNNVHEEKKVEMAVLNNLNVPLPEFAMGGVPTKVAAKVFGKSETWVRNGIRTGELPIGVITEAENRGNIYISPMKLWLFTGYAYKGEESV